MKCRDCDYCHESILKRWSHINMDWIEKNVYKCFGVKEPFIIENIDTECTEYLELRDKVVEEISVDKAIEHFKYGISHDIFKEPVTSYAKLAVAALEKHIPKKVVCEGDDESDYVHCPCCNEYVGSNEMLWDDFYHRDWEPIYCQECGQAMIWK